MKINPFLYFCFSILISFVSSAAIIKEYMNWSMYDFIPPKGMDNVGALGLAYVFFIFVFFMFHLISHISFLILCFTKLKKQSIYLDEFIWKMDGKGPGFIRIFIYLLIAFLLFSFCACGFKYILSYLLSIFAILVYSIWIISFIKNWKMNLGIREKIVAASLIYKMD